MEPLIVGALIVLWSISLATAAELRVRFEPAESEATVPDLFRLESHTFPYVMRELPANWWGSIKEYEVTFPSPVTTPFACNNTVHCEYFAPRGTGPHAGVVVLHILGGDFELSRTVARTLAVRGVGALFLKMPYYGPRRPEGPRVQMISEDLDRTVAGMTQAVLDIRRGAAWLAARHEIDQARLGITGISLGGIVAGLAGGVEPRFERVCLVLAGGDLEQIIRQSVETEEIREVWSKREFNLEEVRSRLRVVDPLTYAGRLKSRQVLMFNAKLDKSIPPDCTRKLWRAVGEPEIHWWNSTHYSAFWFLPTACIQIGDFFSRPAAGSAESSQGG